MSDKLTAEELTSLRITMAHADEGNGIADVPTYSLAKLIAAAERAERLEKEIERLKSATGGALTAIAGCLQTHGSLEQALNPPSEQEEKQC